MKYVLLLLLLRLPKWKKLAKKSTETSNRMLTKFVSIGRYSHEVRAFATLITSTKVFSLIICKKL